LIFIGLARLSSERTLEPARKDCSFAEKQVSRPALPFLVQGGSLDGIVRDAALGGGESAAGHPLARCEVAALAASVVVCSDDPRKARMTGARDPDFDRECPGRQESPTCASRQALGVMPKTLSKYFRTEAMPWRTDAEFTRGFGSEGGGSPRAHEPLASAP
jgi:hypothetical protein